MTAINSVANVVINSDNSHNGIGFQVSKTSKRQHKFITNAKQRTNTILEELPISVDDLTQEDITLYAKQIGIDPEHEPDLLWIAKKGLIQNLPFPWIAVEDQIGRLYYFNCETEQSSWEHPCDSYYRSLAEQHRLKGSKGSSTTLSMSGLTSIANLHFVDEDIGFKSDANGNVQHSAHKRNTQIDDKANDKKELSFSNIRNNNVSDEEVESVDFELEVEEALEIEEELSFNGAEDDEDLVTLDVTEGGAADTKQFKEVHTIQLNGESVVSNEFKYRIDNKTRADSSKSTENSSHAMKDKMQRSSDDDYQSSNAKVEHNSNIKQGTGVSTGGKDIENTVRHNEISDEFLLDDSEDPFAEFDGYDKNYNDLFGSLGISGGSAQPSKYDNSDNYEQTSGKPLSHSSDNQNALNLTQHNISHKPLETLMEASEERDENESESSEAEDEDDEPQLRADDNENNENDNEVNEQQIEYKFEEITQNLTQKISSLRLELKDEIKKQRNTINRELNDRVNHLDEKITKNTGAFKDSKSEILDLRQMLSKTMTRVESSVVSSGAVGPTVKSSDIDRLEKEMQLLRSDVRNESLDSIRELRNELNRDIKSKVNSVFGDLDNKFMDFKDENSRELRTFRTELANVANNSKNFGQQMIELRDDLSQTLADIERQRKEHNKRLERMDSSLSEETQRFQSEVQRLQTLMKTIENKVEELDTERNEIRLLSRLETTEQNNSECKVRIDIIDKQIDELTQRVYEAFKTGDNQNNSVPNDDNHINVVVNRPEQSSQHKDIFAEQTPQETGGVTDEKQPNDILNRMSTIETNIKRISDSFQQMIPIINHSKDNRGLAQNRNTYSSRKRNETNSKSRFTTKHQIKYSEDEDEDEYTSRTSSSLVSSSSISDGRAPHREASTGKRRQMRKRCSHHSIPIKSNKSDVHFKASHKCCIHRDTGDDYYPAERNYRLMKVPLMPSAPHWELQQSAQQLKHIRSSSSSLLSLIKKTSKKLRDEAIELEGLGNYRFVTDFEPIASPFRDINDVNNDETAIKKLKSVRLDVDQKLRKLTNVINQQKSSQI